jgi:hypothetical protein
MPLESPEGEDEATAAWPQRAKLTLNKTIMKLIKLEKR